MPAFIEFELPNNLIVLWECEGCGKKESVSWGTMVKAEAGRLRLSQLDAAGPQDQTNTTEIPAITALPRPPGWPQPEALIAQGEADGPTLCDDCSS